MVFSRLQHSSCSPRDEQVNAENGEKKIFLKVIIWYVRSCYLFCTCMGVPFVQYLINTSLSGAVEFEGIHNV